MLNQVHSGLLSFVKIKVKQEQQTNILPGCYFSSQILSPNSDVYPKNVNRLAYCFTTVWHLFLSIYPEPLILSFAAKFINVLGLRPEFRCTPALCDRLLQAVSPQQACLPPLENY